jgi:hypothetical protein
VKTFLVRTKKRLAFEHIYATAASGEKLAGYTKVGGVGLLSADRNRMGLKTTKY